MFPLAIDVSDIESGLKSAKTGTVTLIKFVVNDIAVPIIAAFLVGLILFLLVKCISSHRQGEDYSRKIFMIIGAVIILALVVSFSVWGWQLIGA
jgi:predicted PurR-regulated permease PerM